jgi:membrane-associated phospholipid phosphatase
MRWNVCSPLRTLAAALLLCLAVPDARAQSPLDHVPQTVPVSGLGVPSGPSSWPAADASREGMPAFADLFKPLPGDFRRMLASPESLLIAGIGGSAAFVSRHGDTRASVTNWGNDDVFEPGQHVGAFAVQTGAALVTYGIGRATASPRAARVGAGIFRAQLVSQATAQAVKAAAGRTRPDGSNSHSFPSGHSASAFATATVLQRELGWKIGMPAYAMAGWVAASRVQMKRHYVSDVIAGATVGILAGRSVTVGSRNVRFSVDPMPVAGGIGVSFTKVARK